MRYTLNRSIGPIKIHNLNVHEIPQLLNLLFSLVLFLISAIIPSIHATTESRDLFNSPLARPIFTLCSNVPVMQSIYG